ncbi:MAG TPA: hypothetical protein VHS58_01870 [Acetobacteraceae bacterium]|jgi:hypothetical protein|nr:hypothetical protein [Acetobacteraceae bacterium]
MNIDNVLAVLAALGVSPATLTAIGAGVSVAVSVAAFTAMFLPVPRSTTGAYAFSYAVVQWLAMNKLKAANAVQLPAQSGAAPVVAD